MKPIQERLREQYEAGCTYVYVCAKCSKYYTASSWKLNYGVCNFCKRDLKYKPTYGNPKQDEIRLNNPFDKKRDIDKIPMDYF
jgi:hypothetical protein